ncbi:hypothetical protein NIES4074_66140 [Cylindrospermum sp. NIES-4074]|nr:hypothetical protein NIES4074_66140 [Cylindrospermum sp. NIES-4074]
MEFNTENQTVKFSYEQPSLKKYGTMKKMTLANSGSFGGPSGGGSDQGPDSSTNPGIDPSGDVER